MNIEVNCLVRFLNAKGGGRVKRIKGDTAYVEDEDGFEMPTPLKECVRVDEKDTFMPSYKAPVINKSKSKQKTISTPQQELGTKSFDEPSPFARFEEEEKEFTPPKLHQLLKAYGEVSAGLYFFPLDESQMELSNYEMYLVNECQYSFYYTISCKQQDKWQLIAHGSLAPKTEAFIEEIVRKDLAKYDELNVQILAFSENPKLYKGTFDVEFKLDLKKFRNRKALQESKLFDDKAIIIPLIEQSIIKQKKKNGQIIERLQEFGKKDKTKTKANNSVPELQLEKDRNGYYKFDLHIDELLDTTAGMDRRDILLYQLAKAEDVLRQYNKFKERNIVFIHGKGEGILRAELIKLLKKKFPKFKHQDASFSEYSYGATRVTIK